MSARRHRGATASRARTELIWPTRQTSPYSASSVMGFLILFHAVQDCGEGIALTVTTMFRASTVAV
jgi:hypothetical protein